MSTHCYCGQRNNINHSLTCQKGGYTHLRHNSLRNTFGKLLSDVCKDVIIEPPLLELTGENLPSGSITTAEARLDISARSFWSPMDKVFTDVRVFHPHAPTNTTLLITITPRFSPREYSPNNGPNHVPSPTTKTLPILQKQRSCQVSWEKTSAMEGRRSWEINEGIYCHSRAFENT